MKFPRPLYLFLLLGCDPKQDSAAGAPTDTEGGCTPSAELCNELDDDCDGQVDEDATDVVTAYSDADADGFGDDGQVTVSCSPAEGAVLVGGDCDDADGAVNPAMAEVCNNGKDDDCDGTSNGCELAGEVSVDWASSRILAGEGDNFTSGLESGDINGDGVADLFLTGLLGSRGGDRGTLFFEGPFEGDRHAAEAYGSLIFVGSLLLGVRVLDDFDGDGVPEFAASTETKNGYEGYQPSLDFFFGGPGELPYPGDGHLEGVGSNTDISGRLLDDQPVLLTRCEGPRSHDGAWCFFREPWESPSYLEYDAALTGFGSSRTTWDAADFDGDGIDELLFDIDDGVGLMLGPIVDGASPDIDTDVFCDVGNSGFTRAEAVDLDVDGSLDLLVGDRESSRVYSVMGPVLEHPCGREDARTRWESDDPIFGSMPSLVGDVNGDGMPDWSSNLSGDSLGSALVFTTNEGGVVEAAEAAAVAVQESAEFQSLGSSTVSGGDMAFAIGLDDSADVAVAIFSWRDAR